MIILDNSIVFTGLPRIQATFGLASLIVGLAPTGGVLIAARALQGVAAAILAPSSLALLTAHFAEGPDRNRAVAAHAAVAGIGASVGLVLGGVVADEISWRAGFLINVQIAAALVLAGRRHLAETPRSPGRFDLGGAVSAPLGVGALVIGVVESATRGWASPVVLGLLTAGMLLLVALVRHESRVEQPILVLRLFASRTRGGAYLTGALYLAAMMGFFFFFFFFFATRCLQGVLGCTPLQAGFAFLPMTVVNFAVAMTVSRAVRRFGNPVVLVAGIGLTLAGMLWRRRFRSQELPDRRCLLVGAGQGLAFAPLASAGLAGARAEDAGAASGPINTAHQPGSSLGLGTLVTVAGAATGTSARTLLAGQVALALTAAAIVLALALVVVVGLVLRSETPDPCPPVQRRGRVPTTRSLITR